MSLPDTQNQAWAKDRSGFGFRMLARMGWKEGAGLGKHEDGVATHVRARRREENLGLGAGVDKTGNASLLGAVSDFDRLLASLNASMATTAPVRSDTAAEGPADAVTGVDATSSKRVHGGIAYHKRLRNKNVAAYTAHDLGAILGVVASNATGSACAGTKRRRHTEDAAATAPDPDGAPAAPDVTSVVQRDEDEHEARAAARKAEKKARKRAARLAE